MDMDINLPDEMQARVNEPLDPELDKWMVETEFGQCLKHPLVFAVPFSRKLSFLANDTLRTKKAAIEKTIAEKNWLKYVLLHERPYRYDAFRFVSWQEISDEEYWDLLRFVWVDTENPHEWDDIRELFFDADRRDTRDQFFMTDEERDQLEKMPDEITIYRGFCMEGAEEGWSWTIDRARAEWFARRFGRAEAQLAMATIRKGDVVAYLTDRGEDEIIADPDDLLNVTIEVLP